MECEKLLGKPALAPLTYDSVHIWQWHAIAASSTDEPNSCFGRWQITALILARYLECNSREVGFAADEFGKPQLESLGRTRPSLQFNLSHSGNLIVLGICRDAQIGVDVQKMELAANHYSEISSTLLSRAEARDIASLQSSQSKEAAFFHCWTRKEAYLKGKGCGFSQELSSFTVSTAPETYTRIVSDAAAPTAFHDWLLYSFTPESGYYASVAVQQSGIDGPSFQHFNWSPEEEKSLHS